MSQVYTGGCAGGGSCSEIMGTAALRAAKWLILGAAPTFATMALFTSALSGDQPEILCAAQQASPLGGMAAMYLLMSAFHLPAWLKLIAGRGDGARRT